MFSLIVAVALIGQSPIVASPERQRALLAEIHAKNAARPVQPKPVNPDDKKADIERDKARRAAKNARYRKHNETALAEMAEMERMAKGSRFMPATSPRQYRSITNHYNKAK